MGYARRSLRKSVRPSEHKPPDASRRAIVPCPHEFRWFEFTSANAGANLTGGYQFCQLRIGTFAIDAALDFCEGKPLKYGVSQAQLARIA